MGFLRVSNPQEVRRITTPEGDDWIELKADFSKADVNKMIVRAPKTGDDIKSSLDFIDSFFEIAVVNWSLTDDAGNAVKPSLSVYKSLSNDAAKWVDEQLGEAISSLLGKEAEEEGKQPSS
jgi:hypothetical protein